MGRWSRRLAEQVVSRALDRGVGVATWLDVGCGPGAVIAAALDAGVGHVTGVEPSEAFADSARARFEGQPVEIVLADAVHLPTGPFDVVVSSLVLNFTPDPIETLRTMARACAPDGLGLAAVWDYDDDRSFLFRCHAAIERVLGHRSPRDERGAFAVCSRDGLAEAAASAGWAGEVDAIEVPTPFVDADDLWLPFLEGIGPSGGWVVTQPPDVQQAVREELINDVLGGDASEPPAMRALCVTTV